MSEIKLSIGVALEDKEDGSDILTVQPTSVLSDIPGDLTKFKETVGSIESTNQIKAIWINYSDIRDSAPDIVQGERVGIFRYGDTDMWYWYSIGRSNELRRLEHIIWLVSNTKEIAEKPKTDNQLFFTVSTRDGYIELITPKNRKEKALYKIKINFLDGIITVEDDNDNKYTLNSVDRHVEVKTKSVTFDIEKMLIKGDVEMEKTLKVHKKATFLSTVKGYASAAFSGAVRAAKGSFSGGPYT